jgi:hypothetical protein
VKEADASLLIGCSNAGNGAVTIAVAPDFMKSPDDNMFRLPDHRFGNAAKAQSGHWMVSDDQLVFDESKLGAISRKAKFLDEMARDTVLHLRYWTRDYRTTVSFNYGSAGLPELTKMIHACRPPKVMKELEKIGSALAVPPSGPDSKILSLDD